MDSVNGFLTNKPDAPEEVILKPIDLHQVIKDNLAWLITNCDFRDPDTSHADLKKARKLQQLAAEYSQRECQTITRIKELAGDPEQLQWLHDVILNDLKPDQETFEVFFKLWSKLYREYRNIDKLIEVEDW